MPTRYVDYFSDCNNFRFLQSSGYQGAPNQQSRLNQWKLPVLEKDTIATDGTDFSRAPGATKQTLPSNSNNMGSLGLQNDGYVTNARVNF